jgi:uncharacterized surface protein with fasciclin (FAS1) repeats
MKSSDIAACVALSALTLAACSGGSDATTPSDPPATAETAAVGDVVSTEISEVSTPAATTPTDTEVPPVLPTVPEESSILAVLAGREDLTQFMRLVESISSPEVFQQARGVTIIAPTDAAWDALEPGEFDALLSNPDAATLALSVHLTIGGHSMSDLLAAGSFDSALSVSFPVSQADGATQVGPAAVLVEDLEATNGFVHIVDVVLPTE